MSVILHIGVGKTGTTSLQHFLKIFQNKLSYQDFYLLKTGVAKESIAHHDLATSFGFGHIKPVDVTTIKEKVISELSSVKDKKIIISSENFHSRVSAEKLENLSGCFAGHDVKIVMYMRRQDQWIDSAFRQFVQAGNQRPIDKIAEHIINTKAVDYRWQIDIWGSVFGYENVIPRVYEKAYLQGGDTVSDFSSIIGLELDSEMHLTRFNANPSLSPLEAEMCRLINVVSKQKEVGRKELLEVLRCDPTIEHEQYHFMSKDQRKKIMNAFSEGNADVAQRFFKESDGVLFSNESGKRNYKKIVNFQ